MNPAALRWAHYVYSSDRDPETGMEVESILKAAVGDGTFALVVGEGFDPRTTSSLHRILQAGFGPQLTVFRISLERAGQSADTSPSQLREMAEKNRKDLTSLINTGGIGQTHLDFPDVDANAVGIRLGRELLEKAEDQDVRCIVLDVSALPTGIYFPILGCLMKAAHEREGEVPSLEVVVLVCENADLDAKIVPEGVLPGRALRGFPGPDGNASSIKIWAPVLGEGQVEAVQKVYQHLEPQEICPVLPFPSMRTRRADDLLLEYRIPLLDHYEVESGNFIHADERNPFDLYRILSRLHRRCGQIYAPLGGGTLYVSTHSSKLMSVGAFLAAYEHDLPVVSAGWSGYNFVDGVDLDSLSRSTG